MRRMTMTMVICVCGLVQFVPAIVQAGTYYFHSPTGLSPLDHAKYYTWGIEWAPPGVGEVISDASLFVENINDWTLESGDHLYIHVLDKDHPPSLAGPAFYGTVATGTDNQGGGDHFGLMGPLLADYEDKNGWATEDKTYDFGTDHLAALKDSIEENGKFALGFDPDCHYRHDGMILTVETIPEPGTASFALLASGCLTWTRRRRRAA